MKRIFLLAVLLLLLALTGCKEVSGTVVYQNGEPVEGMYVILNVSSGVGGGQTHTDKNGKFKFKNIGDKEDITLHVGKSNFVSKPERYLTPYYEPLLDDYRFVVADTTKLYIKGRVFEGDDVLSGVEVVLGGKASQTTVTGEDGRFQFTDLRAGTYTITPQNDAYNKRFYPEQKEFFLGVVWDEEPYDHNFYLQPIHGITGVIRDQEGEPVEGINVVTGELSTTTDASGRYFFEGLTSGTYEVVPSITNDYCYEPDSKQVIAVDDALIDEVNFEALSQIQPEDMGAIVTVHQEVYDLRVQWIEEHGPDAARDMAIEYLRGVSIVSEVIPKADGDITVRFKSGITLNISDVHETPGILGSKESDLTSTHNSSGIKSPAGRPAAINFNNDSLVLARANNDSRISPGNRDALVINPDHSASSLKGLRTIFEDSCFTLRDSSGTELSEYKSLDQYGVLIIRGHGGDVDGVPALMTGVEIDNINVDPYTKYSTDWTKGRISADTYNRGVFLVLRPSFFDFYYGRNKLPNSMVMLAACNLLKDDAFSSSLLSNGAGAVLGFAEIVWSNFSDECIEFVFSEMVYDYSGLRDAYNAAPKLDTDPTSKGDFRLVDVSDMEFCPLVEWGPWEEDFGTWYWGGPGKMPTKNISDNHVRIEEVNTHKEWGQTLVYRQFSVGQSGEYKLSATVSQNHSYNGIGITLAPEVEKNDPAYSFDNWMAGGDDKEYLNTDGEISYSLNAGDIYYLGFYYYEGSSVTPTSYYVDVTDWILEKK